MSATKDSGPSVNFPPVLNGLDFLESTVDLLAVKGDVPSRNLKYAVVHLASTAETLFKARLAMKKPALVWAKPDAYDRATMHAKTSRVAVGRMPRSSGRSSVNHSAWCASRDRCADRPVSRP